MGLVPNIILLAFGVLMVIWIYRNEAKGAEEYWRNPRLGIRPASCSPDAFRHRIRVSIAMSLLWRMAMMGTAALAVCAFCWQLLPEGLDALGNASSLHWSEYLSLWLSTSMILLGDRVTESNSARY